MTDPTASARSSNRLQVLMAALLFSTGGAAVKSCALSGWQVAAFRSGIAAVAMILMLPAARRAWSPRILPVAAAYAANMILYIMANKLTLAANTIFLQSTAPLYILLLGPVLLGERIRRRELLFVACLGVGMALFFLGNQPASATATHPALGNLLAGCSGFCWALTILGLRWLSRSSRSGRDLSAASVAWGNLLACLLALPFAFPVTTSSPIDWWLVIYLGVFQVGLAYVFLTRGVRRVSALEVSLLLLLEPLLNPFWAFLLHGERPTRWSALGGAIIIFATAANTLAASRGSRNGPAGRQSPLPGRGSVNHEPPRSTRTS